MLNYIGDIFRLVVTTMKREITSRHNDNDSIGSTTRIDACQENLVGCYPQCCSERLSGKRYPILSCPS